MSMSARGDAAIECTAAFERALAEGRLSHTIGARNYVGDYMYMGATRNGDAFKHKMTRQYLAYGERT